MQSIYKFDMYYFMKYICLLNFMFIFKTNENVSEDLIRCLKPLKKSISSAFLLVNSHQVCIEFNQESNELQHSCFPIMFHFISKFPKAFRILILSLIVRDLIAIKIDFPKELSQFYTYSDFFFSFLD